MWNHSSKTVVKNQTFQDWFPAHLLWSSLMPRLLTVSKTTHKFIRVAPLRLHRYSSQCALRLKPAVASPTIFAAGTLVKLAALIAGNAPVKFAAGKLVKLAPEPP